MKDFRFIFLRLSCYLIAGILLAFYIEIDPKIAFITGGLIFFLYLFAFYRARKTLFPDSLAGISTFFLIFYLGFIITTINIPKNQPEHYINQNIEQTDSLLINGVIVEELKPNAFSYRYVLEASQLLSSKTKLGTKGKLLVNIRKDSLNTIDLIPGTEILLPWKPESIKEAANPFQFSYSKYLKKLKIEKQINVAPVEIFSNKYRPNLKAKAWNIREHLILRLKKFDFGKNELAVFQALILGQRRDINDELYKNYAAAGAIHILAISGLHIGILLLLLNYILKPVEALRYGNYIKPVLVIILLWSFAFLTGLSPSVVRAVSMFSFLAIGLQLKRKTSSLNSLFLSLFVLLLLDPYYIFQVGFQLSYLAVFSILIFQPIIYKLFTPKFKVIDYFWKLSSVSLAAQIGVLPLSIFYFHQFPGLFLLSNLIILPFLGIILILGITLIILALINLLPVFLTDSYSFLLKMMNVFVEKIAAMDGLVLSNINLSLFQTLSLYAILLFFISLYRKITFQRIILVLAAILFFQVSAFYHKYNKPQKEAVVFHKSKQSIIGLKENNALTIYTGKNTDVAFLKDYIRERDIKKIKQSEIPAILNFSNKLSLVIDTSKNYSIDEFHPQLLILRNSPRINLDRLLDTYTPQQIIADGSNYTSYIERWEKTAEHKKIPFHYTGEKGAYILKE